MSLNEPLSRMALHLKRRGLVDPLPGENLETWWKRNGDYPAWSGMNNDERGVARVEWRRRQPADTYPDGICYAITHIDAHGMRTLTFANQGRNHRRTAEEAQHHLNEILKNTPEETLRQCYGAKAIGTFEVRPVECYPHGDAKRVYFDKPVVTTRTEIEAAKAADLWSDIPDFPREDWRAEVRAGDTQRGYWDWVEAQLSAREDEQQMGVVPEESNGY